MNASEQASKVVVAGASAGGVEALAHLVAGLPEDFGAPLIVVLHMLPGGTSMLAAILDRAGPLPATTAHDSEALRPGHVYVAPPDHHVLVEDGLIRVTKGPRENGHRPALDPTMRSVAAVYGTRAVGIVLSGNRDDGSAGLARIKQAGGWTLVQDPEECVYKGMPSNAIERVAVDEVLGIDDLSRRLAAIVAEGSDPDPPDADPDPDTVSPTPEALEPPADTGGPTRFTCPECGGVLFEHEEGGVRRYRCSVGHAYSDDSLDAEQERELESALWAAVRSLEDRAALLHRLAERAAREPCPRSGRAFDDRAQDCVIRADAIRRVIRRESPTSDAA